MFPKLMAESRLQDESRDDVPIHHIVLTRPPDILGGRVNNHACVRPALLFKSGSAALLSPADGLRKAAVGRLRPVALHYPSVSFLQTGPSRDGGLPPRPAMTCRLPGACRPAAT